MIQLKEIQICDKVTANRTKNGYWIGSYTGRVEGFTKNGLIKVNSRYGVRCHARHNIRLIQSASIEK